MYKKIVFVCTGNSCRSPMAEGLLKKMLADKGIKDIKVTSCGFNPIVGSPAAKEAVEVMQRDAVDISGHRASQINKALVEEADLILVMENRHKENVFMLVPQAKEKVFLLKEFAQEEKRAQEREGDKSAAMGFSQGQEIGDPIGKPIDVYEKCLDEIKQALEKVVEKIA